MRKQMDGETKLYASCKYGEKLLLLVERDDYPQPLRQTDNPQSTHLQPNLDVSSSDLQTQIHLSPARRPDIEERCL